MSHAIERVNSPDDPRRCHGNPHSNQCWNVAADESDLCPACAADAGEMVEVQARRQYLLTDPRYQARLAALSEADEIKSLRDEVAIARMLIEERLNKIKNDHDLYSATGAINSLLLTVEKLVSRSHILEQNLGQLLHKSTIIRMAQAFVEIIDEEVSGLPGGVEAKDRIISRIFQTAMQARNEDQARGIKLLPKEE
jgi:uncharacterized membrane protein YccC